MTTSTLALLDQAELLQLATNAGTSGDAGAAIGYLKEAVSRTDATGIAHFLLGSEYAQIKMYDRAADEMEAALALDPALSIARLQLGLLWLTGGIPDKASALLAPLDELPDHDPLRSFGKGLRHLIKDEFADTVAYLEAGIVQNTSNAALNLDMRRIIDEIGRLAGGGTLPTLEHDEGQQAANEQTPHILLSAYTGNTTH